MAVSWKPAADDCPVDEKSTQMFLEWPVMTSGCCLLEQVWNTVPVLGWSDLLMVRVSVQSAASERWETMTRTRLVCPGLTRHRHSTPTG